MSSLREKERAKEQQDKLQAILSSLLKDEDNKYCVDCDAKGPRWASWNLGVFLCIRCAGIHRNLGVHISKVKSVNLDSWTPEQVAMMQEIGNSRGRAVYEANIPDGFRRPQSDSALEAYVRSKYEQKKYIAREWVPPHPKAPKDWYEDSKAEKKKARNKPTSSIQLTNVPKPVAKPAAAVSPVSQVKPAAVPEAKAPEQATSSASNDLLGLDLGPAQSVAQQPPVPAPASAGNNELLDIFGGSQSVNPAPNPAAPQPSGASDLMNGASETNLFGEETSSGSEKKGSTKDSIMALFAGSGAPQPQMYGVPGGMYVPQGQQMYSGMMGQPQGMMGQPQGMMGAQPQGMMGTQSQGMMGQPQGMMGTQPQGMMGNQSQGMMGNQSQGMMGNQSQGMMGNQSQGMMGQPQGMMGQQPQGMMGNPQMNGAQANMFGQPQMMGTNQAMYTPQQMQQLQFQQMQQQMTSMKLSGAQMGNMPQQATSGMGSWGNQGPGQTLSTNLWQ